MIKQNHNLKATDAQHIRQDLADDARSQVQRDTPRYSQLHAKRMALEQTFSCLQELEIETDRHPKCQYH